MADKIKCYYKQRCKGGINIHGFLVKKTERRETASGVKIMHFPPVCERVKIPETGEFFVDDSKDFCHELNTTVREHNRKLLKKNIEAGIVELDDEDLQEQIMGSTKIKHVEEVEYEVKMETVVVPKRGASRYHTDPEYREARKAQLIENIKKARAVNSKVNKSLKNEEASNPVVEVESVEPTGEEEQ